MFLTTKPVSLVCPLCRCRQEMKWELRLRITVKYSFTGSELETLWVLFPLDQCCVLNLHCRYVLIETLILPLSQNLPLAQTTLWALHRMMQKYKLSLVVLSALNSVWLELFFFFGGGGALLWKDKGMLGYNARARKSFVVKMNKKATVLSSFLYSPYLYFCCQYRTAPAKSRCQFCVSCNPLLKFYSRDNHR